MVIMASLTCLHVPSLRNRSLLWNYEHWVSVRKPYRQCELAYGSQFFLQVASHQRNSFFERLRRRRLDCIDELMSALQQPVLLQFPRCCASRRPRNVTLRTVHIVMRSEAVFHGDTTNVSVIERMVENSRGNGLADQHASTIQTKLAVRSFWQIWYQSIFDVDVINDDDRRW